MSNSPNQIPQDLDFVIARVPREVQRAQVKENKSAAAGREALWSSLKELRTHTGLIEGAKLLAKVNQDHRNKFLDRYDAGKIYSDYARHILGLKAIVF